MTVEDLAELVQRMRTAQREYFRTKSSEALRAAKRLEAQVDRALRDVHSRQPSLF